MQKNIYNNVLENLKGKTIVLVYAYRGEQATGIKQYDAWKGDVVTDWITAIEEIGCFPLIMDVRTFVFKSMMQSLPHIDFVINLCNGTLSLSTLGLVPSTCSFLNIPCIPCEASIALIGENKKYSNLIAEAKGMNVPKELSLDDKTGIFRPINFGSSKGVTINPDEAHIKYYKNYVYQEFIRGFDITTPIMYNPILEKLEVLPAVIYCPANNSSDWFLGEKEKDQHIGYKKMCVNLSEKAKQKYLDMANAIFIDTYCRIDARIKCESSEELMNLTERTIEDSELFFLEINPMPTIKRNINFHNSLKAMTDEYVMKKCLDMYLKCINNASLTGFILTNSIFAKIKAKR